MSALGPKGEIAGAVANDTTVARLLRACPRRARDVITHPAGGGDDARPYGAAPSRSAVVTDPSRSRCRWVYGRWYGREIFPASDCSAQRLYGDRTQSSPPGFECDSKKRCLR